jgi:hypothetical protein
VAPLVAVAKKVAKKAAVKQKARAKEATKVAVMVTAATVVAIAVGNFALFAHPSLLCNEALYRNAFKNIGSKALFSRFAANSNSPLS